MIGWLVPHVDKVLPNKCSGAVVDHLAFIEDTNLVKEVIHVLGGLVNCRNSRHSCNIGADAKGLNEHGERGRRIETSR